MNSECIMMSSCKWYELIELYTVAYGFLGYIILSAVFTFTILLSIARSK